MYRTIIRIRRCGTGAMALAAALAFCLTARTALAQNTEQWKFNNKTGVLAKDLHLKFDRAVIWPGGSPSQTPANSLPTSHGNGTSNVSFAQGFTGTGVTDPGNVVMEFQYEGTKPVL